VTLVSGDEPAALKVAALAADTAHLARLLAASLYPPAG
jgi:hypothetical protein